MTGSDRDFRQLEPGEAITITEAAAMAGKAERTLRAWCRDHKIGLIVRGHWHVSKVALSMLLAGDLQTLEGYLGGDRTSARVTAYFERAGVPLLGQGRAIESK